MYENLMELRTLRAQEDAIEARIKEIAGAAAQEAVEILAAEGRDRGQFTTPDGSTFQLQRTDVYDFANYHKYQDNLCIQWRKYARIKADIQSHAKQYTQKMATNIKAWVIGHPDKEPDKVLLTVKVVNGDVEC